MRIVNEEYKFSFEVPDDFEEIPQVDYEKYHIHDGTLNIFVKVENGVPQTISLNRDDEVEDEDDYIKLVLLNLKNMEGMGMKVSEHIHHYHNNKRVDIVYSNFKNLKFVTYFTVVHKLMIACSIEIKEINDVSDRILADLFDSIEEQ